MRKRLVLALLLALAVGVGWFLPPLEALASTFGRHQNPQVSVERLTGEAAWRHLDIRIAENPRLKSAYERSRKEMFARGYNATWTVYVEKRIVLEPVGRPANNVLVQILNLAVARVSAQEYSESNESGEFIASAWDDGNDNTWEGSLYVHRYSDGAWRLFDTQLDAGTSEDSSNEPYYHDFLDGQGGHGPDGPLPVKGPANRKPKALYVNLVAADSDAVALRNANAAVAAQAGCDWLCKAGQWASCTRAWCTAAAIGAYGCRMSGPGWLPCFGAACTGVQVACVLQTWF